MQFVHLPKTGGFWVREVMRTSLPQGRELGRYHSCALADRRLSFTFVRHPVTWWQSFWAFRERTPSWHPEWQRFKLGMYSEYVDFYASVDFVGRTEHLAADLRTAYEMAGEAFPGVLPPPINTSPGHVKLAPELVCEIEAAEHSVISRFYP
jgi:hypothetical protein